MSRNLALIQFEERAIEDRSKTNETGHIGFRSINVACITPVGGRLVHEKEVTEDLLRQWKHSEENRHYYDAYMAWKDGAEAPVNGQPLKMWPPISPEQVKNLNLRNIRSVEELAELPDDALSSFGPGYRIIRDKAREWLKSSSDIGKVVEQLSMMKQEIEKLKADNEKKEAVIQGFIEDVGRKKKAPK